MKKLTLLTLSLASLVFCGNLSAVPSYTRNLGIDCTTCHTAFPQLTEFGKVFLETAGDLLVQEDYGALSMTPYPLSGRINLRPIDKRFSKDSTTSLGRKDRLLKLRAFHEVEVFLAGRVGDVYYFAEFEAEDEWCDEDLGRPGFDVRLAEGYAVWRLCEKFNLFLGYDTPFALDGNDTVHHHKVLRRQWKAADYVPDTSQMIGFYGQRCDWNFIVAWHGDWEDCEGHDPESLSFRTYYEWGDHTFGSYFTYGKHYISDEHKSKDQFYLYGVDAHFRYDDTNIMMLFGIRDEHHYKPDWDFSIEANTLYTIDKRCCISKYLTSYIPVANLDVFVDRSKSSNTWIQGAIGVAFYLNPAVRIFPQVEGTIMAPPKYKHKEHRWTLNADIGI